MRVKSLHIQGLTKHTDTRLDLPATGLVVVTGDNGSGKSTLIEAVPVCRFGKSLRGTDLWSGPGEVVMELYDGATYRRKRTASGRTSLQVEGQPEFQTASRANREIGGDPKLWQRSCVFSFEDVVSFTRATDSERKKMLEQVLGLERFEEALQQCRAELSVAQREDATARSTLAMAEQALTSATRMHHQLEEQLAAEGTDFDTDAANSKVSELEKRISKDGKNVESVTAELSSLRERVAVLKAEQAHTQGKIESEGSSECHTCGRPFAEHRTDVVAALRTELSAKKRDLLEVAAKAKEREEELTQYQASVRRDRDSLSRTQCEIIAAEARAPQLASARKKLAELSKEVENANTSIATGQREVASKAAEVSVLEASAKVLGLRGLRAHVLREALEGLEIAANYWLERFSPGVSVTIRPQRELKGGGTSDEITVELEGVAGGHGYKGSSRGERRRQDVAITWALGEVEAAATGQSESTVWCDEPFDALDTDGVDALVSALEEVRERRCVVVISHSPSLIEALRPDAHYHVTNGKLERMR